MYRSNSVYESLVQMMCDGSIRARIIGAKYVCIKHGVQMACAKHALTVGLVRISVDKRLLSTSDPSATDQLDGSVVQTYNNNNL